MTTQSLTRDRRPTELAVTWNDQSSRQVRRLSWRSVGPDLAYLTSGFFLTLFSFVLLVPLFAVGLGTLVLWIGLPILGFTLLTATGFARENRELLRRWGAPVAEPAYRQSSRRRILGMLLDPHAWLELLHGTLVALPLRIVSWVVPLSWLAAGLGSVTWFIWGIFLPRDEYNGVAWLLVHVAGFDLGSNMYLAEAATMFITGVLLLVLAPVVTRCFALLDAGVARAMLGGHGAAMTDGDQR